MSQEHTLSTLSAALRPSRAPLASLSWALLSAPLLLALAACSSGQSQTAAAPATPAAPEVGVVTVTPRKLALATELPGRTVAVAAAEIRPQVNGIVQQRLFTEGSLVKAGQPLYQLDAASYQATVASAEAAVRKAEATLTSARLNAQRQQALLQAEAGSRQSAEDAQATLGQAEADLQSARATLASARIDLSRTRIVAPIGGRIDTSTVTPGALVTANQTTALTTVQQLDPIYVDMPQSSVDLLRLRGQLAQGKLNSGSTRIRLVLEDGSTYAHEGQLQVAGVAVNTTTGAVTLRATVPNPERTLLPGMYVRAVLAQAEDPAALLVPQAAVSRNARGEASALVVAADGKASRRAVTVAEAVGNQWRITAGLAAGERVVVEGAAKVQPGQLVLAVPVAQAAAASAAAPASAPASGATATVASR